MAGDQGAGGGLMLALIAAVARNGAIGANNALPWRLSSDLQRFKALTMGKAMLMGRKTFESIGKPLPGRRSIVVTRDKGWSHPGVEIAHDFDAALALAGDDVFVVGGADIFALAIARAEKLYITEVDLDPAADARFPDIDLAQWRETKREAGVRGPRDEADFDFVEYERRVRG